MGFFLEFFWPFPAGSGRKVAGKSGDFLPGILLPFSGTFPACSVGIHGKFAYPWRNRPGRFDLGLSILVVLTSIVAEDAECSTEDQLVLGDDNPNAYEQTETDLIKYLKDKLVQFYAKLPSYGNNVASSIGIQKIASEFEILVFGPARVGKSTLIKQISGDATIKTSAQLNGCTQDSERYIDEYNIHWWDTPCILVLTN
jgi:hypothetical protein